ncbi:MAG: AraC family transcriptional regulator [Lawsonibacter sp.]
MQVVNIPIDRNQMETTRHGSFAFPLAVYQSVLSQNVLGFINWHWHEELQFCYVTAGAVRFFVHEQQYLLRQGEGIFVNSGYLHMARPAAGADSAYLCLDASPRLISSFQGSVFDTVYVAPSLKDPSMAHIPLHPDIPWQRELLTSIPQIHALYEHRDFGYELEISLLLSRMWLTLLQHRGTEPLGKSHQRLQSNAAVQAVLTYLHGHYGERLTLEQIAKAALFSPSECCRLFKKVTGETIFSYLQSYRLTQSVHLLQHTDLSVSQIAYETGFCSTSYFIEVFKDKFGITPHQYRKTDS